MTQQISSRQITDNGLLHGMARQAIINGNFDVWQRGTSFVAGANNDDVYKKIRLEDRRRTIKEQKSTLKQRLAE